MAACGVSKCGPAARAVGIAVVGLGAVEAGVADPAVGGAATGVVGARAGAVGAGAVEAGAVGAGGGTTLVGADTGGSGAFPPHPAAASMRAARAAAAVPGRRRAQSNMEGFIWSPVFGRQPVAADGLRVDDARRTHPVALPPQAMHDRAPHRSTPLRPRGRRWAA